jgi:hypothetical protein
MLVQHKQFLGIECTDAFNFPMAAWHDVDLFPWAACYLKKKLLATRPASLLSLM